MKNKILTLALVLTNALSLIAQKNDASVLTRYYYDYATQISHDTLFVSYDDLGFRHYPTSLQLWTDSLWPNNISTVVAFRFHQGIPCQQSCLTKQNKTTITHIEPCSTMPLADSLMTQVQNPATDYLQLIVHPEFNYVLGNFDNPFKTAGGINPELRLRLGYGLSLSAQMNFLLFSSLDGKQEPWHVGILQMNKLVHPLPNLWGNICFGKFDQGRIGIDAWISHFSMNHRLSIYARAGYTTSSISHRFKVELGEQRVLSTSGGFDWFIPRYNLSAGMSANRFLAGDYGIRADINRQFKETIIGFYVMATDMGTDGGFHIRIPLYPSKYPKLGKVIARPTRYFNLNYKSKAPNAIGLDYKTRNNYKDLLPILRPTPWQPIN